MERISFRRPRNQLTALRKHRSIIFRSISLDSTNDSASVFIPSRTNTNGRKKKITNQSNSDQYLTESVLLPSGVVVQLPINLKGSTTKQRKSSGNSNRKSNKKSSPVLGEEQYVSSPIGKRKAQFEADLTLSIRSVTKRGRLTRKGMWRHVRFLQCFGSVPCESSNPIDAGSTLTKNPLPTIYETQVIED